MMREDVTKHDQLVWIMKTTIAAIGHLNYLHMHVISLYKGIFRHKDLCLHNWYYLIELPWKLYKVTERDVILPEV